MTKQRLTITIITLNEEANLERCLKSVRTIADEVILVDSGSSDRTLEIARTFGAIIFSNPWKGYGQQKNLAQSHALNEWVLNIDADEEISPALRKEIQTLLALPPEDLKDGYTLPRLTRYLGRWIRHGGWYPNRLVRLAKKSKSHWSEPQVHEELIVEGSVGELESDLFHYTFRSIQDQILTNLKYSRLGTETLRSRGTSFRLFWVIVKPIGKFLETYILKAGFLDGVPGFIISINASHSIFLKYANLYEPESAQKK